MDYKHCRCVDGALALKHMMDTKLLLHFSATNFVSHELAYNIKSLIIQILICTMPN
jgi:hypothetical protein